MVTEKVARRFWHGGLSGLEAWNLITPNRASSNIGEFAILLPGEERIVITKEVFVVRVIRPTLFDHFYLLWALSLKAVRDQWRRVALMQTNREDCGLRYREIILPKPKSKAWASRVSKAFHTNFTAIAEARGKFIEAVHKDRFEYVANVANVFPVTSVPHFQDHASDNWEPEGAGSDGVVNRSWSDRRSNMLSWSTCSIW